MVSRAAVDQLLERFQYRRFRRATARHLPAAKRPFRLPSHHTRSASVLLAADEPARQINGIKIFDPRQVFRQDFPFSWCDGVVKKEGSTYAPIQATASGAMLVLAGKPGTSYVVCALPLQPTWLATDVREFRELCFDIRVAGAPPDVFLSLVSQNPDQAERESHLESLKAHGLEPKRWVHISLPLAAFADSVDLSRIRLMKLVGYDRFTLELRRVYIA